MSSIFLDENVLGFAAGSQNNIRITNERDSVNGLLQDTLQFSVEADWENIFSLSDRFDSAKKALSVANLGLFNAGMWTKKFYKGGSYLKINPKIRVVDWNATGEPLAAAEILLDMCLPVYSGKLEEASKKFLREAIKTGKSAIENGNIIKTTMDVAVNISKVVGKEIEDVIDGTVAQQLYNLIFKGEFLSNSPTPVRVDISNFYSNDFLIDSVQVEFSKEMTQAGPLYVDIQMALSTPMVTTRGRSGVRTVVSKPRFIQVD